MRADWFALSARRAAVLYVVLFAVSVAILLVSVQYVAARVVAREVDNVIRAELEGLLDDFREGGVGMLTATIAGRAGSWGRNGAVYLLVDAQRARLAGNLDRWPFNVEPHGPWVEFDIVSRDPSLTRHPVRALLVPVGAAHSLLVGTDVTDRLRLTQTFHDATLWGVGLTVLIGTLLGWAYVRRSAKHVADMTAACREIMSGNLSRRLAVTRVDDDFDRLATAVNSMVERIEAQTLALKATLDSTAHDLRQPLHRARMRLEALLDGGAEGAQRVSLERAVDDLDHVQQTLTMLLQIATAEARLTSESAATVDLAALAGEVADLYEPVALERGQTLRRRVTAVPSVRGERQLVAQLLANLVDNALKFSPRGATVQLSVETMDRAVRLAVSDEGPGIPASERDRVLRPFVRLERDSAVFGTGLGLALVAAVARLYGARLALEERGPGLCVSCDFPLP